MGVLVVFRPGDSLQCANEERPSSLGGIGLVGKAPGDNWFGGSDATKRVLVFLFFVHYVDILLFIHIHHHFSSLCIWRIFMYFSKSN